MGLEVATFISQLVATNPVGATDQVSQGDDHLRLLKSVLQASFTAITGAVTSTHLELNQLHGGVLTSPGVGAANAPTYSFAGDADTGMYRSSADTIGFSTNGLSRVTLNTVRLLTDLPIYNQDGNVGAPAYSFTNDTDSGLFRLGANDIRLSTGGVARMIWNDTINYSRVVFQNVDGTSGTPAYSFEADPDTGIYRNASNDMRFVAGGAAVATMLSTGFFAQQLAFFPDGLVGGPGISFTSDTNTGIYRLAADYMGFTAGGILAFAARLVAATPQLMIIDGTIANPSLAFDADVDTGFYRAATNDMAMSVGGIQAFRAANVAGVTNITIGAPSAAGTFSWNTNTSASATAGSSGALPAQVDGYISVNLNGANRKIPFYAN